MKKLIIGIVMTSLVAGSALAEWTENVKIKGDFRYRHEIIDKEGKDTRNRQRIRARLSLDGKASYEVDVKIRLASGSDDPVSSNQTLDGGFSSKHLWIDRAYFDWHPEMLTGLHLQGGKTKMPFVAVSDLIWDGDLNPEGLALKYKIGLGEGVDLLVNGAGWWVEERSSDDDSMMFGGQLGLDMKLSEVGILIGGSYFNYTHMKDFAPAFDSSDSFGNSVMEDANGNLTYANEFKELEAFAKVSANMGLPMSVFGNFVNNTDPSSENNGFLVGISLGKTKDPGTFKVGYDYRKLEKDAVVGAFCDSDSWGGGTDGKGHRIKAAYQISKHWQLAATGFMDKAPISDSSDYKRLQIDLKAKF